MRIALRRCVLTLLCLSLLGYGFIGAPLNMAKSLADETTDLWQTVDGVPYRTLQRDMQGEDVLRMKQQMQALGFFEADAQLSDIYNSTMEYKVKKYQNALGIEATGIAIPKLQATLFSENGGLPTSTPVPTEQWVTIGGVRYRTLSSGATGDDVLRLKQRLKDLGFFYDYAELTDSYNSTMEYRVKQYQNALAEKATGIATPELQALAYTENGGLPTEGPATPTQVIPTPTPSAAPTTPLPETLSPTATVAPVTDTPAITEVVPTLTAAALPDGQGYRTLSRNMNGEDVLRLKQRMQALGLFEKDAELTDSYNTTMERKIGIYQKAVGLKVTGIATPEVQALIYAEGGSLPTPTPAPTPETVLINGVAYRTLKRNMTGEDVQRLKKRLLELGYFPLNSEITDQFNTTMEHKVKEYQADLGVKATGIATPEIQAAMFADYGSLPTPIPLSLPSLPPLNAEGFLPSAGDEFVFEDAGRGQWIYLSNTLRVEITRYSREGNHPLIWFETELRFTASESFHRYDAHQKFKNYFYTEYPQTIAARNNIVLAFNDDFYGIRGHRKQKMGVIIRDGEIIADDPYRKNVVTYMPPLDILAFFGNGSVQAMYSNEHTAEELLSMGVTDTLSFGPVLLRDGQVGQQVADGQFSSDEPRCALGMIEPRHFVLITVEGRHNGSKGIDLGWIARRMREKGVQEALNLDGGNTTALVFRGQLLNKIGTLTGKMVVLRGVRSVSSVMGIGLNITAPAPTPEP